MKKLLILLALLFAANAYATYYTLVKCEYKYVPEYSRNLYLGKYKSQYGNYFYKYFESYCPASFND